MISTEITYLFCTHDRQFAELFSYDIGIYIKSSYQIEAFIMEIDMCCNSLSEISGTK